MSLSIIPFSPEHRVLILQVLVHIGWEQRFINGQLQAIERFANDPENSSVFVALQDGAFGGFVSIEFYQWNRLAQIHGLAVDPSMRRRGIAARLVEEAEHFAVTRGARGVYVDTPVTNTGARDFYLRQQYKQDYIMTAYYACDLDGVTYLKLFS